MSAALAEYFDTVTSSDVFSYGFGAVADFLDSKIDPDSFDWVHALSERNKRTPPHVW